MQINFDFLKWAAVGMAFGFVLLQAVVPAEPSQQQMLLSATALPATTSNTMVKASIPQQQATRMVSLQGAQSAILFSELTDEDTPTVHPLSTQGWTSNAVHGLWAVCWAAGALVIGYKLGSTFGQPNGKQKLLYGSQDVAMMATYSLKLITPDGEKVIQCRDDQYILDAADEAGLDLPYSCRTGSCSTCACKLVSGDVDQGDQAFLNETQQAEGLFVICQTTPKSDCVIKTHQEDEVWNFMR